MRRNPVNLATALVDESRIHKSYDVAGIGRAAASSVNRADALEPAGRLLHTRTQFAEMRAFTSVRMGRPACGRAENFGVLVINGASTVRRCRERWYDERFDLPDVAKTLIYLDQMAISIMT